ncbi:MAG: sulfatase-like hydrolase/transferase, partial [Ignavibacteria bacterium]|nr:sulfatase-like hydrolase/transferase [Ignavibacteria bacterium]
VKKILISMIKSSDEEMLDDNYFFMRQKKSIGEIKKRNIVIFIMESWSAQYVGAVSGKKSFTPFFDSLARNGVLFTNFLASGQRSIEAVPSILASLPAVFPKSIIGSRSEINKIRGLGSILSEYGYNTSFHHGASSGSMGFDAYLPSAGFSNYYTKSEFKNYADSLSDGVWGIYDEPFFLDAIDKIDNLGQPFCSVIFSLSSHDPMKIPDYRKNLFEKFSDETDFEKSVRYSDFALKQFFENARKKDWFDNTIFIITADHTIYTTRNDVYEAYHVPLLIYAPKDLQPKVTKRMGSHVDILPSILDLLNIPTTHSSMGISLFDEEKDGFAVVYAVPYFFYFKDDLLYVDDFTKKQELFDYHSEKFPYNNSIDSNKTKAEEMSKELKAYVQASTSAINKDLIYKK